MRKINQESGMSTGKKVVAGTAVGIAVPAAVVVAKKLLGNGDNDSPRRGSPSGPEKSSGSGPSRGRTKEQLYNTAKRLKIEGRSRMTKQQLERAIARKRS
jgi:hypothetical protein